MIISASRRTDIPAFYSTWLMNRIQAGYCTIPHPYYKTPVSSVSLRPEDVDLIVFWTRHPAPLISKLEELTQRGYRYYFQYTVMDNPRPIDPGTPPLSTSLTTFQRLSDHIGPDRVIWRYDPIVLSDVTSENFHLCAYKRIAEALEGYTHRSVISIVDIYRKIHKRMDKLDTQGIRIEDPGEKPDRAFAVLMQGLACIAEDNGMEIASCAETFNLQSYGVNPGKCVDDAYIEQVFGIEVDRRKDPSQRKACGCVVSKDIGMYDTCLFGCVYCYATGCFEKTRMNHDNHDPDSPSLTGWYEREGHE